MRFLSSLLFVLWLTPTALHAQTTPPAPAAPDTTRKYANPDGVPAAVKKPWYKGKLVRATIVPAVLIGYGASTINGNGIYSSYDARRDIQRQFPNFHTKVDDYLIFAPYAELGLVALAGVESRSDRLNTLLVVVKSELIYGALTYAIKNTTKVLRPDGSTRNSFPSGHTAQAFLAASIVHTEFRDQSQWYGIGAYTIATGVGALRMLNNRHWQSDVVAGAGIGILSAHLGYLSHRNRWGRKPHLKDVGFAPSYYGGATGFTLTWRPQ
ncbi:phosphatase PAP2 family protein [Hymenobacter busanensis]|uniref:Phosphatase PAP2 family protein n=1 Tax=Hymenobacter busanensis TaxID=2607656 RepID=A0A7L4ZVM4_9BACT|nr:phosphatase PAP2 family protein [Hymenobacter busanensis]KAA9339161.1 phosphatase PAP2 family protein [Hymenobacter busanensis]QHJ07077.1 phosphatase PAP2 family protein [Hymenobacter busanensis]